MLSSSESVPTTHPHPHPHPVDPEGRYQTPIERHQKPLNGNAAAPALARAPPRGMDATQNRQAPQRLHPDGTASAATSAAATARPLPSLSPSASQTVKTGSEDPPLNTNIDAPTSISRQPPTRPLSNVEGYPTTKPLNATSSTPLQRHFHHQRHQSGSADLRPSSFQQLPTTTITSPEGEKIRPRSVDMPYTGDLRGSRSRDVTPKGMLSGWLPGKTSSPFDADSPLQQQSRSRSNIVTPGPTPTKGGRKGYYASPQTGSSSRTAATEPPSSGRFAFLSSSLSALTRSAQSPVDPFKNGSAAAEANDELFHMDIEEALFPPAASPSASGQTRDPFSPAAYKNLEMNATSLLNTFQTAYRRQAAHIRELRAERVARNDEVEEAEMRTQHLKQQLENLAMQAAEQEAEMKALVVALEKERMVGAANRGLTVSAAAPPPSATSDGATIASEDLGAEEDQRQRTMSWQRKNGVCEDTDEESVGEAPSVFSRSRSPTLSAATAGASGSEPSAAAAAPPSSSRSSQRSSILQSQPQPSALQKLMKGFSGEGAVDGGFGSLSGSASCRGCHGQGQDGQMAWDTVGLLRDENRTLKVRVAELENCVEGALDAVNGVRM